jgi:hypothetical protein
MRWLIGAMLGLATAGASAQPAIWQGPVLPGLKRVDEGVADRGPLSVSQRVAPVDLRVPSGFQGVYQFDQPTPFGKPQEMFARSSGGLTAVFPRSVYIASRGGLVPEIPAGTVFLIGKPRATPPPPPARPATAIDMSIAAQGESIRLNPAVVNSVERSEPVTIWNSERLRQQRLGRMLESVMRR